MKTHRIPRPAGYLFPMLLSVVPAQAPAEFVPLGDLPGGPFASLANAISADGTTVVGHSATGFGPVPESIIENAFLWTEATGIVDLGTVGRALDVSADGTVIVGLNALGAFRWTQATGLVSLGIAGTPWGVSADGTVVVGQLDNGGAFRWTEATGVVAIGGRVAFAASADGAVVVGGDNSSVAFRWTQATGLVSLGALPGGNESVAAGVSADGSVVVGGSVSANTFSAEAFRWTHATGMVGLGDLPGGQFFSFARAVSADGAVIVGGSDSGAAFGSEAFVWDEANGMRNLREVLIAQGDDLAGWQLVSAMDVSADGRTIAGWGFNPARQTEGWIARLAPNVELVSIDIKPGGLPNSINPKSKGKIPVAILTTETFDATRVDPATVRFGRTGTEAAAVHFALADVDGNGNSDMILHFKTRETRILCGDSSAALTGKTFEGQTIEGSDSIRTVGCK